MSGEREPKPAIVYAEELSRVAVFIIQQVAHRRTDSLRDIPDERDFREVFTDFVERIQLEASVDVYRTLDYYRDAIEKVNELKNVNDRIDQWKKNNNFPAVTRR